MDFIMKLLPFRDPVMKVQYDSIWVIVNRYSKWAYYLLFKESYNAKNLRYLWRDRIIYVQKNSKEIISDWNKFFILAY